MRWVLLAGVVAVALVLFAPSAIAAAGEKKRIDDLVKAGKLTIIDATSDKGGYTAADGTFKSSVNVRRSPEQAALDAELARQKTWAWVVGNYNGQRAVVGPLGPWAVRDAWKARMITVALNNVVKAGVLVTDSVVANAFRVYRTDVRRL